MPRLNPNGIMEATITLAALELGIEAVRSHDTACIGKVVLYGIRNMMRGQSDLRRATNLLE